MKHLMGIRPAAVAAALLFLAITAGCASNVPAASEAAASPSSMPMASATPSPEAGSDMAAQKAAEGTPTESMGDMSMVPVSGADVLYQDNFTDPASGWTEDKFDNYFIGYHEPEYYHVEVTSPNYKTAVFAPNKESFGDFTVELKVLTSSKKTSPTGDFRYGVAFRRSGDQYYAFAISPRSKKWYILKSSPNAMEVLKEGTDENLHDLDTDDTLRVDAKGSNLAFHINDRLVEQLTDAEYANGEIGLYVESFDSPDTHVHFDDLLVRKYEAPMDGQQTYLYQDNFSDPTTKWPDKEFDNYFIGYHEPEYYRIALTSPHYKATVFAPDKLSFGDATIETQAFVASSKTSPEGDFRYGVAFRRSGDNYYAFTVSPRTKKWFVLKSSPNALEVLKEGTDDGIHGADKNDALRVDAKGPNMLFHINDKLVGEVTDPDYATGEVGLYAESIDSPITHIHFDSLSVRNFEITVACTVNAQAINVRTGPGKDFSSSTFLVSGDSVEPLGRSQDNQWLKIRRDQSDNEAWIFNSPGYLSCSPSVDLLPVINP